MDMDMACATLSSLSFSTIYMHVRLQVVESIKSNQQGHIAKGTCYVVS